MKPRIIVLGVFVVVISFIPVQAREWRGLIPMKSTCEDAKRILGIRNCESDQFYSLNDDQVRIGFTERPCDVAFKMRWNVPVGTITYIELLSKEAIVLSSFGLDESRYEKSQTDVVGLDIFSNEEEGLDLWVFKGYAQHIVFRPTLMDRHLQCKPNRKQNARIKKDRRI